MMKMKRDVMKKVVDNTAEGGDGDGGAYVNCRRRCPLSPLSGIVDVDCSSSAMR